MDALDALTLSLSKLPGIGRKSARRIAFSLLKTDDRFNSLLASQIIELKEKIRECSLCGTYCEGEICPICDNPQRDRTQICVVEQSSDSASIESTGEFHGLYHVLHGTISPLDGVGPQDLTIDKLLKRCDGTVKEVIIATNATVEGDTTALYLVSLLKEKNVKVSRLASGLPVGGDLEYIDKITLSRSLRGRIEF